MFVILEKIARLANDSLSRSFCEYQLFNILWRSRIAMKAMLPFY